MARASTSLPTPDSPSIRIGMLEAAARSPSRITRSISALRVTRSLKPSVPLARRAIRRSSLSSARLFSAFLIETCSRSAPTGLTTKSAAPARIAEITASIEPCAVCTMTGRLDALVAHPAEHAHAVEIGHHQIEDQKIERARSRARARPPRRHRLPSPHSRSGAPSPRGGGAAPDRRRRSGWSRSSCRPFDGGAWLTRCPVSTHAGREA